MNDVLEPYLTYFQIDGLMVNDKKYWIQSEVRKQEDQFTHGRCISILHIG